MFDVYKLHPNFLLNSKINLSQNHLAAWRELRKRVQNKEHGFCINFDIIKMVKEVTFWVHLTEWYADENISAQMMSAYIWDHHDVIRRNQHNIHAYRTKFTCIVGCFSTALKTSPMTHKKRKKQENERNEMDEGCKCNKLTEMAAFYGKQQNNA